MARTPRKAHGAGILVLPDQLTTEVGPLAGLEPGARPVILLQSREWLSRRPYHIQRIALILLHMHAFAEELSQAGHDVRIVAGEGSLAEVLQEAGPGPWIAMEPAEREMRIELGMAVASGSLSWERNGMFMTTSEEFRDSAGTPWKMDSFYRAVRKRTGILMDASGKPEGGKLSFDSENRKPWKGTPKAPDPPRFDVPRCPLSRAVRERVSAELDALYAQHPGTRDLGALPATRTEVMELWDWARAECLPHFGPWEDAMSTRSRGLFHTRISPVLNLGRILPGTLVRDALALELPLASKEGFVRQVIGWREFVRHVHRETDGFRSVGCAHEGPPARAPGDAGYARWSGREWMRPHASPPEIDGGARPAALAQRTPLPPAYWGTASGMRCLDRVVSDVWAEGWSHHITRLMVLGNIATLLDVSPRELTDWFWAAYADAWEWVVEPNVLGMATFGAGPVMTTKPYVCGGAYIDRMSDYCGGCAFDPSKDCPVTALYWAYLDRHQASLDGNPRMWVVLRALRQRPEARRMADAQRFVAVRDLLVRGERIDGTLAGLG